MDQTFSVTIFSFDRQDFLSFPSSASTQTIARSKHEDSIGVSLNGAMARSLASMLSYGPTAAVQLTTSLNRDILMVD